jgi:hypothetical protein
MITKKLLPPFAALLLASCDAGNGKNDILGFMPGMKRADLHSFADAKKWRCEPRSNAPLPNEEFCFTMTGQVRVVYAANIDGEPVEWLGLNFTTTQTSQQTPLDIQSKEISTQYGKNPDSANEREVTWKLDNGNVLTLSTGNSLVLENPSIQEVDAQTVKGAAATPKF